MSWVDNFVISKKGCSIAESFKYLHFILDKYYVEVFTQAYWSDNDTFLSTKDKISYLIDGMNIVRIGQQDYRLF